MTRTFGTTRWRPSREATISLHAVRRARRALLSSTPRPTITDIMDLLGKLADLLYVQVSRDDLAAEFEPKEEGKFGDFKCLLRTMNVNPLETFST